MGDDNQYAQGGENFYRQADHFLEIKQISPNKRLFESEIPNHLVMAMLEEYPEYFTTDQKRSIRGAARKADQEIVALRAVQNILNRHADVDVKYEGGKYFVTVREKPKNGEMKPLIRRGSLAISKNKLVTALNLFEQYVDETVSKIEVYTPTLYLINEEWQVDIATNKIRKIYPDIE